ncbi:MAG: creatininase family protein, partial [Pseudomonas fluorescens]|nr:creatininase family protein [Pseudomonas fluorescens]
DGRMGSDPALATVEKGGELVALAAQGLVNVVDSFSSEAKP